MIRAIRCFKCHQDTAVLTYEENRIYKVSCPCGCEYSFEHSSQKAAHDYHLKMVELYAEIDRNAALKAENTTLRSQLTASQQRERAAAEFIRYLDRNYARYMAEDERFKPWRGPQEAGEESRDEQI